MSVGLGLEPPPWVSDNYYWQRGRRQLPKKSDDLPTLGTSEGTLLVGARLPEKYPHNGHKGNMVVVENAIGVVARCVMPGCMVAVRVVKKK